MSTSHEDQPNVAHQVARSRLLTHLRWLNPKALLLIAPPGCGKRTLVRQYLEACGEDAIWHTQDEDWGKTASVVSGTFGQDTPVTTASVGAVVSVLSAGALDDSAAVRQMLSSTIERQRAIVIIDSDAGMITFSPQDRTCVLNARDLRFTDSETLELLRMHYPSASPGEFADLMRECDGHVGLLCALAALGSPRDMSHEWEANSLVVQVVDRMLDCLRDDDRQALQLAALMSPCSVHDLELVGTADARSAIQRLALTFPLLRVDATGAEGQCVQMSNMLVATLLRSLRESVTPFPPLLSVVERLLARRDWAGVERALEIAGRDDDVTRFIEAHGRHLLDNSCSDRLIRIVDRVSLSSILASPRATICWADALQDRGLVEEGDSKARAAYKLAAHADDWNSLALATAHRMRNLTERGQGHEAIQLFAQSQVGYSTPLDPEAHAQVLSQYAISLGSVGQSTEARSVVDQAMTIAEMSDSTRAREIASRVSIQLEPLLSGEWMGAIREIGPLLELRATSVLMRQTMLGNLAYALIETGKVSRARKVLQPLLDGSNYVQTAFTAANALIDAAEGNYPAALATLRRARLLAQSSGYLPDQGYALICQALIQRASGDADASLCSAERAYELFAARDYFGLSCRAATEVAASHLALEDVASAQRMLDVARTHLRPANGYHALGISLTAAAMESLVSTGDATELAVHRSYITGESALWLVAMYCRCFPSLVTTVLNQWRDAAPPARLLRLLDSAEPESTSMSGREVVSVTEGAHCQCEVRLFGGLEIKICGRTVSESDWVKGKARLLFLMLVVKRGMDVPRDQILDYLWPEFSEERARNNFYVIWSSMRSTLRRATPPGLERDYVRSRQGRCSILLDAVTSDLDAVDKLLSTIQSEIEQTGVDGLSRLLEQLVDLYRGELLPGDVYDDWFHPIRHLYAERFVDALGQGAARLYALGQYELAETYAKRALAHDPLREDLCQIALNCCTRLGKRSSAIRLFTHCRDKLADELGLDPMLETRRLYSEMLSLE